MKTQIGRTECRNRHYGKQLCIIVTVIVLTTVQQVVANRVLDVNEKLTDLIDRHPDKSWLVKFYAPWCHHCIDLEPTYRNVAEKIYHNYDHLIVARVDCTKSGRICESYGVDSYPTIIFLTKKTQVKYRGERSEQSLIDFADRLTKPSINNINDCKQLKTVTDQHELIFLSSIRNKSDALQKEFESIAESYRFEYWFYQIAKTCTHPKIGEGLYLLKRDLTKPIQFQTPEDVDDDWLAKNLARSILEWARNESLAVYGQVHQGNVQHILTLNKLLVLVILDEYKPSKRIMPTSQKFHEFMGRLAKKYAQNNDKLLFGWTSDLDLVEYITMTTVTMPNLIFLKSDLHYHLLIEKVEKDSEADIPEQLIEFNIKSVMAVNGTNNLNFQGGNSYSIAMQRQIFSSFNKFMRRYRANPLLVSVIFGFPSIISIFVIYTTCCNDGVMGDEDENREDDSDDEETEQLLSDKHMKRD